MNKISAAFTLALIVGCALPISPLSAAQPGGESPFKRDPYTPGAPALTPVVPSAEELTQINTALKSTLSASDPAAKAVLEKHPTFNPLAITATNPPPNVDGNFIIGPIYLPAPETIANANVPKGTVNRFTMNSEDSKIYPGIGRDVNTYGTVDPNNPKTLLVPTSHPQAYKRNVSVYVPAQYVPGTAAPFIVTADGPEANLPVILDNLIAQHRVPTMIAIMISNGSGDAQGSERGLEYDTMSGKYAEFVETEVLPQVEKLYNVTLTKDPEGRATMGGSSGGSCALEMAWYHTDLYHRVLTYSGTYVNQQWPFNPETPDGAWDFHEHLIPESPVKPIRIWLEVGDTDLYNPNSMRDGMHDWVLANQRMAAVLHAKGYHYQYVFAQNAQHVDGNVKAQTLPEALEWLWQGYPKDAAPAAAK
ncbi:MAG TPA: alpha/beta hydrolase-fold protein [Opitutales bacterium]|jgi:enterochelin esterase family protein|nr:alpha/beta hydrolase-fold protein [Opitutales bacterium]